MNDDLKVAVEWLRGVSSIGNPESPTPVAALLAHIDDEQARQDAAVTAARALCAKQCAEALERSGDDEKARAEFFKGEMVALRAERDALLVDVTDLRSTCAMLRAQVEAARAWSASGVNGWRVVAAMERVKP